MLILKNPSCKVHISECHQPHWVTPCQLDLPVDFKNSPCICLKSFSKNQVSVDIIVDMWGPKKP